MKLIPQWKKWWKRHSVQLLALVPIITVMREQLPIVRDYIDPSLYSGLMVALPVAAAIVMQIQQKALSGEQS